MEFHVWGTLDENGRIQSVQSSCCHGNSFNLLPDLSSQAMWLNDTTGEKFVPYATKKELTGKLDSKIDEMSLIMVQMGELTKRLKLQEKLISEYEEKAERQTAEINKLRHENDQFRSMITKRRRNDSSCSLFEEPSVTTPKVVQEAPMDTSDTDNNILTDDSDTCSNSAINGHAILNNIQEVHGVEPAQVTDIEHDNESGYVSPMPKCLATMKVPNSIDNVPTQETGTPLAVDDNGYVPMPAVPCGSTRIQDTDTSVVGDQEIEGVVRKRLSVEVTVSESQVAQDSLHETNSSAVNPSGDIGDPNQNGNDTPPAFHKNSRVSFYSEIPDESVSPVSPTSQGQTKDEGQGHDKGQANDVDRYRERPPMPIPPRRKSESSGDIAGQLNRLSKEFKNSSNDETKETSGQSRPQRLCHRYSSPDLSNVTKADDKLKPLIQNMKTTMEWNEARKLLMAKSHTCTTEMAETVLYGVVKDTHHKCAVRLSGSTSKANLTKSIQKYLLKKNNYDADILTIEFLGKCIHLMMNS